MEKSINAVRKYEDDIQLKILRGQCLNNSATLLAGSFSADVKIVTAKAVFNFAEALFNEAIERDYLNYGKIQDERTINKATGKVAETPISAVGGVPVTLTEKEGRGMDSDARTADETDGLVI